MTIIENQIEVLKKDIAAKQTEIENLRKELPLEEIKNYLFKDVEGKERSLLSFFEDKEELLLIHNMGKSCVYCTMWADVLSGMNHIVKDRVNIVLTSPDDVNNLKNFSESRKWNLDCYSYHGTDFSVELGFAYDKEGRRWYQPGVSALILKDGKIYRTAKDYFGPGDVYCAPWHLFNLLPKGDDGWQPKYAY